MLDQDVPTVQQQDRIRRFSISDRVEHWLQVITFVGLAFTGLIQKWPEAGFSQWAFTALGGIETTRFIHRVFATMLLLAVVYHLYTAGKRIFVERAPRTMLPATEDVRAAWKAVRFHIGRDQEPPVQGRFTWEEKIEYWAIVWGTLVMTATGFMLWNPIATARFLPGQFIPAAKAAHGGEALLAVLAILVWHFYHVHLRHFNTSIFTGYMSRREMEKEHALELAAITAGEFEPPPMEITEKRRRRFVPLYSVFAGALLIGIYFFVTFEDTAIETIKPPEDVIVFVPAPTPTVPIVTTTSEGVTTTTESTSSTTAGGGADNWTATIEPLLSTKCGACHTGDSGFAGLDLSIYASALAGGATGPGIVPGDPDSSAVYEKQEAGGHAGQLNGTELATLRAWIEAGAPETPADAGGGGGSTSGSTWDGSFAALLADSCGACHGAGALGGLDVTSFSLAVEGGNSGPGIVPGDSNASKIYTKQAAGGHPGQLTDDQIAELAAWIDAGASEK